MRRITRLLGPLFSLTLAWGAEGCQRALRPPPTHSDLLESRKLDALSESYIEGLMQRNPVWATYLGDRRFDTELQDLSPEAEARFLEETRLLREAVDALDPEKLAEEDRVTQDTLLTFLDASLGEAVCQQRMWNVNALDGLQAALGELPALHPLETPAHAASLEVRYLKTPVLVDQHLDNLRQGMAEGYWAAKVSVQRVLEQLDGMLAPKVEKSTFLTSVRLPSSWRDDEKQRVRRQLSDAVRSAVYPALQKYRDFLRKEYLPKAREAVGVSQNPHGEACYLAKVRSITGLSLSVEDIHQLGLQEVARLDADMKRIATQVVGSPDVEKLEQHLAHSPAQTARSREELVRAAEGLIQRAEAALPQAFRRLPSRKVELKQIEAFREKDAPSGYYYEGNEEGTRPGYFYLNTYAPTSRPLYQLEPLTFHEAIPGHHLQIARAQDLKGLPRFRRLIGQTAYTEGWGLYAEQLADELGLYSGPEARFGMLSYQALRAVRLVVDTGMHARGWSREQAIAYALEHTAESEDEVRREVDRYIAWPGQALAYKIGQREIVSLREKAKDTLGAQFDLRAFHDVVLENGAVPLPVLRHVVEGWMEKAQRHAGPKTGATLTRPAS